jgi:uncharacterized membrane protein YccC
MAVLCLAFRLLVQVNYGLGVAMLSGMLVLLMSFEGIAPGDAIQMRVLGTLLGSGLALLVYAAWPTWEGPRANLALAKLIDSYRAHIHAVLGNDIAALHETRNSARAARTGVLASLERLRAEPKRAQARKELVLTESFLANAHRLIRTSLALEAVLRDEGSLPQLPELAGFSARVDRDLAAIAATLRGDTPLRLHSPRPAERRLAEALEKDPLLAHSPAGLALADTCDRIADGVDTLAHLLRRTGSGAPQAAMAAAG